MTKNSSVQEQKISVETWRNLETTLVWAYRGTVSAYYTDFLSENKHLSAWLILEGGVQLVSNKEKIVASADQWIFVKPGSHHQVFRPGTRLLSIHFQMAWLTGQSVFPTMTNIALNQSECPRLRPAAGALS